MSKKEMDISSANVLLQEVLAEMKKAIIGQQDLLERLVIAICSGGHVLLEGVPGLAKTKSISTLAKTMGVLFRRIQFTPDLLPSDLIGTRIYNPKDHTFSVKTGPVFANFILADEINRAPAKVQSALLEAMQEKQVTIGEETLALPSPFFVLATQNPIEQEGTYALPEAQTDRFLMKVTVSYPSPEEEIAIMNLNETFEEEESKKVLSGKDILALQKICKKVYADDSIKHYIRDIVFASRHPASAGIPDLTPLIAFGASPRASIALLLASKAMALLRNRDFVTPDDIKDIGKDVLRHRIIPTYEAEAEEVTTDHILDQLFGAVRVP